MGVHVSVPSSSGLSLLAGICRRCPTRTRPRFSPLVVGALVARGIVWLRPASSRSNTSPRRRGSRCASRSAAGRRRVTYGNFSPLVVGALVAAVRMILGLAALVSRRRVSVPSSSGLSLLLAATPGRCDLGLHDRVSSPLVVGALVAAPAADDALAREEFIAFQSPRRRGSRCSASSRRMSVTGRTRFQSPRRRGSRCSLSRAFSQSVPTPARFCPLVVGALVARRSLPKREARWLGGFSPLVVGALVARGASRPDGRQWALVFQSPRRRGSRCSVPLLLLAVRPPASSRVSVPSSSGLSFAARLQVRPREGAGQRGAVSVPSSSGLSLLVTTRCLRDGYLSAGVSWRFQIPSSSGLSLLASTRTFLPCQLFAEFQSPRRRGSRCSPVAVEDARPLFAVSVPSSSGLSLLVCSRRGAVIAFVALFQSPRRRGSRCSLLAPSPWKSAR